jgi:hypothetical protein
MDNLHPFVFVLLAYGIAAVIAVCVGLIIKVISHTVQRKKVPAGKGPAPEEDKGGNAP